jgi:two-component system OmpR family response regulator
MTTTHIAVLDDERDITALLAGYLGQQGFRVSVCHRGNDLLALMASDPARLVLLDLGLPGEDGLAIARALRERSSLGLIIVTGRGDAIDRVVGLELGADDYVTKPFELRELLARVRAVLRRVGAKAAPMEPPPDDRLQFCGWSLDLAARTLNAPDGRSVVLTTGEFDLLAVLARHAGRVLTRDFLISETRGRDAGPFDRTIDVLVGRLRRKIELDPAQPEILKSVRGAGYILVAQAPRS